MKQKNKTVAERLDEYSLPVPWSGCALWMGRIDERGYGRIYVRGRNTTAHRAAWEVMRGQIPHGLCVLHKCDVKCCVNPEHLFLGTQHDNVIDMSKKGRGARSKIGLPRGVARANTKSSRFHAQATLNKRHVHLGTFATVEEAAAVAAAARQAYWEKL